MKAIEEPLRHSLRREVGRLNARFLGEIVQHRTHGVGRDFETVEQIGELVRDGFGHIRQRVHRRQNLVGLVIRDIDDQARYTGVPKTSARRWPSSSCRPSSVSRAITASARTPRRASAWAVGCVRQLRGFGRRSFRWDSSKVDYSVMDSHEAI